MAKSVFKSTLGRRQKIINSMKAKDIKGLSVNELAAKISEETASLSKLKLNHSISPLDNPMVIRDARRTIARLKTELTTKKSAQ